MLSESMMVEIGSALVAAVATILLGVWRMFARYEARNDAAHAALGRRIDAMGVRIDRLAEGVNGRFDAVNGRIDGVNDRIDGVNDRIDGVNDRIDKLHHELTASGKH